MVTALCEPFSPAASGDGKFLFAKMLLLLRMCSDALVIIALVAVASSLAIALISTDESGGIADSGKWSDVVLIFLKTVYGLLPFIALGVFITVLTTSRGVGIALSVGYFIVESILATLLRLNDTLADVADYLLIQAFLSWTDYPVGTEFFGDTRSIRCDPRLRRHIGCGDGLGYSSNGTLAEP